MRRGQQTPSVFNLNIPPRTHETASTFGNSELFCCSETNKLFSGNGSRSFLILIMATASEMRIQQLCGQGTSGMPPPPCQETEPPPRPTCGQLASNSDVSTRLFTTHNSGAPTHCVWPPLHQVQGSPVAQYLILRGLTIYQHKANPPAQRSVSTRTLCVLVHACRAVMRHHLQARFQVSVTTLLFQLFCKSKSPPNP